MSALQEQLVVDPKGRKTGVILPLVSYLHHLKEPNRFPLTLTELTWKDTRREELEWKDEERNGWSGLQI